MRLTQLTIEFSSPCGPAEDALVLSKVSRVLRAVVPELRGTLTELVKRGLCTHDALESRSCNK